MSTQRWLSPSPSPSADLAARIRDPGPMPSLPVVLTFVVLLAVGGTGSAAAVPPTVAAWLPPMAVSRTAASGSVSAGHGYVAPVPGAVRVLTPFDPPEQRWLAGHRGVDLAAAVGSTIRAAGPGVIAFAGTVAGRGVISIVHDSGLRTTYEPVSPTVLAGRRVAAGDPIGALQGAHASCAPASCLHWGARLDGGVAGHGSDRYVDPMALLGQPRVRLEPWEH